MTSFAAKIKLNDAKGWRDNALRFATSEEASEYGGHLVARWDNAIESQVVATDDPVNTIFANGQTWSASDPMADAIAAFNGESDA